VILESLQVIGETIAEEEFDEHPYATYYDPDALSGNQAIESVVVLRFEEDEDGLNYLGPRLVDPDEPLSMAIEYGYSNRYNQYDHSLTQRASSSITKELDRLFAWPTSEEIGGAADEPLVVALDEAFEREADAIRDDIESREEAIEYKALLTVSLVDENGERYPGEVEVFNRGIRESYMATIETSSSAVECSGETRCTVCDELTRTFGLGANLDNAYTVKKQWPFPEYNSSLAWQSRPLCIDCVVDIEVALDHFIGAQDYGAPGVRCRVIPYALPVDGASERLRRLVKNGREPLIGTGNEQERKRPLSAVWDAYRGEVELGIEDDFLRLAFTHYVRDSAKTHGVAWIDGISTDQVRELETTAETVLDESPVFEQKQLPKPNSPNERQIFTGMWLFGLLTEEIDSNHDGENTGDDSQWAEYTERLLTNGTIPHDAVVASDRETEAGVLSPETVESALVYVSEGYFGEVPETIHEKAAHLMRLLAAEHPFVDGNKRTALNTAETFYDMNSYEFDHDDDIRKILKRFATDQASVEMEAVVGYCREHSYRAEE
jgi:death-on-curing protein